MAHALTEAASTVVLILLATWVAGRPIVGMLAGLCFSLYPEAIRRTPGPATEPWFTFLFGPLCSISGMPNVIHTLLLTNLSS